MPTPGSRTASWPIWSRVAAPGASRGVALTRWPERSPGCSLGRTYPARDRAWRGGTSGSPSRRPGPRCPRPQVGDPGGICSGVSFGGRPQGRRPRRRLRGPPEAPAPPLSGNPPRTCSLVDEGPLELRHAGEDRQHHLAGRRGCIGPRFSKAAQAGTALLQDLRDLQQVARGARKPVEPGDHDDVALPELVEHARQRGPVARRARDLLLVDAFAPGLLQCGALKREVLIVC